MQIVVSFEEAAYAADAEQLALRLQLPYAIRVVAEAFCLRLGADGLSLHYPQSAGCKPIQIDFLHGALAQRAEKNPRKNELIARAFGFHKGRQPSIIDATAGLGRDAFLLASMGATVLMLERSPLLHALLADALARYEASTTKPVNLRLLHADALLYLKTLSAAETPDIIYLDPMFPERRKSALVKKEMRLLKQLVGEDNDAEALFAEALLRARKRVVVKRPRLAAPVGEKKPSFSVVGSANRFDVYEITGDADGHSHNR